MDKVLAYAYATGESCAPTEYDSAVRPNGTATEGHSCLLETHDPSRFNWPISC